MTSSGITGPSGTRKNAPSQRPLWMSGGMAVFSRSSTMSRVRGYAAEKSASI